MKKAALILASLFCLAACTHTVPDSGCITIYKSSIPNPYNTLTAGQLDTIHSLFNANNLPATGFLFTSYYSDSIKSPTGDTVLSQAAFATLTVNDLPVFLVGAYCTFFNGVLYPPYTTLPQYPYPGNDTSTRQTPAALRSLFFKTYEAALYSYRPGINNPPLARPGTQYRNACLKAQLGYLDAGYQPNSGIASGKRLLKVWSISPDGARSPVQYYTGPRPAIYVIDSTGQAWLQNSLLPSPEY